MVMKIFLVNYIYIYQVNTFQANFASMEDEMPGGQFDTEQLRLPEFYQRDLIGGFTEEQETMFLER